MAPSGLFPAFLAAIQASLSVLLVIFYGGLTAHFKLLDSPVASKISKLCVKVFLPALLFVKIGSELHLESASRYLIVLAWAFACHLLSFLIGMLAHFGFGMPDWITAAVMFNNTTSYPLLLISSLNETGILQSLIITDETTSVAIERAKSYFLVFATISSCLTFSVGPRLIDSELGPEAISKEDLETDDDDDDAEETQGPNETTGLLSTRRIEERYRRASVSFAFSRPSTSRPVSPNPSGPSPGIVLTKRRPSVIPKRKWLELTPRSKWWLLFLWDFLNAPLLGALVGAIAGLIPPLHTAFFSDSQDGGLFTAWLTASLRTIGQLFVPLPVLIAGVSLYTSVSRPSASLASGPSAATAAEPHPPREADKAPTPPLATLFTLLIRFLLWPLLSIPTIYLLATRTAWLSDDPMLWFALMLMPTGPPAMKLITMVQVSGASETEEHKIARLLTVSYVISPVLAFTVVGALSASQAAIASL